MPHSRMSGGRWLSAATSIRLVWRQLLTVVHWSGLQPPTQRQVRRSGLSTRSISSTRMPGALTLWRAFAFVAHAQVDGRETVQIEAENRDGCALLILAPSHRTRPWIITSEMTVAPGRPHVWT